MLGIERCERPFTKLLCKVSHIKGVLSHRDQEWQRNCWSRTESGSKLRAFTLAQLMLCKESSCHHRIVFVGSVCTLLRYC